MREILCRGKLKYLNLPHKKGEWVYGNYVEFKDGDRTIHCIYGYGEVIPETVGRYIGLTDKNGVKIFEGDIVKTKYGRLCVVIWFSSPNFIGFDLSPIEDRHSVPTQWDLYKSENLEIVGNIYDNPELLNDERNDENVDNGR